MDSASQQKILGYFIEEAKEHLETLEQGLMDLAAVVRDPEKINEMFRAAHSVKGGSAMLGYNSIQKTAHRLEDCFKVLREQEIPVNNKLENLFFQGYDTLNELIEQLEGPFGLQDDEAEKILKNAEPAFLELEAYLNQLVGGGVSFSTPLPGNIAPEVSAVATPPGKSIESETALRGIEILKEMLALFKQKANNQNRKQLQDACVQLAKLSTKNKGWQLLTKSAYKAISNPKFSYRMLAPVIIQELKEGCDAIALGQADTIHPSSALEQLAKAKTPQVLIPVEPKAAAKTLKKAFNAQQLSQLVQLLGSK
ncbi:MAG: Hpt domain-containing protein [Jaaginema sp. PMC 1079.18]|nr:Hpt domain-containing protein [Jaaginema sp. PMC 1080.18]MEC4849483.1 Hpt domain-containing protein [Jaaginema sp. PMC 1079.18]MEC4866014.1 Hpt domain-containing protein [Jaaginema sp. PMC 1078.18]